MKSYPIYHMPIKQNSTNLKLIVVPEAITNSIQIIFDNSKNYEVGFMPSLWTSTEFQRVTLYSLFVNGESGI